MRCYASLAVQTFVLAYSYRLSSSRRQVGSSWDLREQGFEDDDLPAVIAEITELEDAVGVDAKPPVVELDLQASRMTSDSSLCVLVVCKRVHSCLFLSVFDVSSFVLFSLLADQILPVTRS